MDSYTKSINFDIDLRSVEKFNQYMTEIKDKFLTSEQASKQLTGLLGKRYSKSSKQLDFTDEFKDTNEELMTFTDTLKQLNKEFEQNKEEKIKQELVDFFKKGGGFEKMALKAFFDAGKAIANYFKEQFKAALKEALEMASYSLMTTTKYNRDAWQNMMQYGLTGQESYAFSKAKSAIGVQSDEEFYQAMMSPSLQQAFKEYFDTYKKAYEEDIEFATNVQEYQKAMEDFNREMQLELLGFLSDNKDIIQQVMKVALTFMDAVLDALGWMLDYFGEEKQRSETERASTISDIIGNYTTSTNNTNISIDNTFNNVGKEDQTWLSNAGSMTYEQIIKALT